MRTWIILILSTVGHIQLPAQELTYPPARQKYAFVNYAGNTVTEPDSSNSAMAPFYQKLQNLILNGTGPVNIVHIGGSHIQAGVYTGLMREELQRLHPGINAGSGLMFPYRTARTTVPKGYKLETYGKWTYCRNTQKSKPCLLGLTGMSVTTGDSLASMLVVTSAEIGKNNPFNTLRIFHGSDSAYRIVPADTGLADGTVTGDGYTDLVLKQPADSIVIRFEKLRPGEFTLYGLAASASRPGVLYHSVGSNGSDIGAFLRCRLLSAQLKALQPDLVILSLGTNDTYTKSFKPGYYASQYEKLFAEIYKAAPGVVIMLTVPNDSYMYRKYPNQNTEEAEKVILNLAGKYNLPVWNFYRIMGGFDSALFWEYAGLMKPDKIHFNRPGYEYKGELFFDAFMKGFENYLTAHPITPAAQ